MAKVIIWKDVLTEAEALGQSMFEFIAENTSSPGDLVVDENGEKVTAVRWAEAFGMSERSMQHYIRRSRGTAAGPPTKKHSPRSAFRSAPVAIKAELVREAIQMYPEVAKAAFKAAAPKVDEADRRAASAHASRLTEPMREAAREMEAEFVWAEQLTDIAEEMAEYEERPGKRALTALRKAVARVNEELEVLEARIEMERSER